MKVRNYFYKFIVLLIFRKVSDSNHKKGSNKNFWTSLRFKVVWTFWHSIAKMDVCGCMYVCTYVWMYRYMYGCMHRCIYMQKQFFVGTDREHGSTDLINIRFLLIGRQRQVQQFWRFLGESSIYLYWQNEEIIEILRRHFQRFLKSE